MSFSAPRNHGADKAVWGRAILFTALISFALPGIPAEAQLLKLGQSKASAAAAKQAEREARKARRHAKLDQHLNDAVEDKANGESAVIIEFHDDRDAVNLVKANGGKAGRRLGILKARVAKMPNRKLKALANDSRVKRIHLDRPTKSFAGRTAVTVGARAVQELMGYNGAGVGVGVIDSGITEWHDDLTVANGQGQRMAHFADFVNGYTQPYDDFGHGTHVAGIVAGNGRDMNGARTAIAPGAHIISLKALDGQGNGTISMIIAAIDYAVANKDALNIRVLNLSLGATVTESYNTDPLTLAAKRAVDAGIVVVASAGNTGKGANGQPQYGAIGSPGNAPWVITVGASSHNGTVLRQDDTIAGFSSRGPTMYDFDAKPDLVAPGHGTVSLSDPVSLFYTTKAQYLLGGLRGTSYTPYLTLSGTSMAAPVVAGTVALMLQANPSLTPNLVKAILQFTSQEYPGYDALTQGTGFLNTRGAVVLAEYFQQAAPGSPYPSMNGWSKQIFWGNKRVRGGVPVPGATAWARRRRVGQHRNARRATTSCGATTAPMRRAAAWCWPTTTTTTSSGATPTTTTSSGVTPTTTTSSGATIAAVRTATTSCGATATTTTSSGATPKASTTSSGVIPTTTTSSGATPTTTTSCGATPTTTTSSGATTVTTTSCGATRWAKRSTTCSATRLAPSTRWSRPSSAMKRMK